MRKVAKFSFVILTLALFFGMLSPESIWAKRLLPQANQVSTGVKAKPTKGVTIKVSFRADRKAIIAVFSNLKIAKSVEYSLTYKTNGIGQAVVGRFDPATSADPRTEEIIFGTCSAGVCRYDTKITNAKFVVTTTLTSGKKVIKTFNIKKV